MLTTLAMLGCVGSPRSDHAAPQADALQPDVESSGGALAVVDERLQRAPLQVPAAEGFGLVLKENGDVARVGHSLSRPRFGFVPRPRGEESL